jgi:hypothetical protein
MQEVLGRINQMLSFDMTWSAYEIKNLGGIHRHTDGKVILLFFQNKESRLKNGTYSMKFLQVRR